MLLTTGPSFPQRPIRSRAMTQTPYIASWESTEFQDLLNRLKNNYFKKIVVLCGAGLSTSSGIADFRSPRTGLYDNLGIYNLPYPEALFELEYLKKSPKTFFQYYKTLMLQLEDRRFKPNLAHQFLKLLADKNILTRIYTQNIDGFEKDVGIDSGKLVQAHGSIDNASCINCKKKHSREYVELHVKNNSIPRCNSSICNRGLIKPNVVFFGEDLPSRFWLYRKDLQITDLVIIMGTSLSVEPFNRTLYSIPSTCPVLLMNNKLIKPFERLLHPQKIYLHGDLVETVQKMTALVDWDTELYNLDQNYRKKDSNPKINLSRPKSYYDQWTNQNIDKRNSQSTTSCSSCTLTSTDNSSITSNAIESTKLKKKTSFSDAYMHEENKKPLAKTLPKKNKRKRRRKKYMMKDVPKSTAVQKIEKKQPNPYPENFIEIMKNMKMKKTIREEKSLKRTFSCDGIPQLSSVNKNEGILNNLQYKPKSVKIEVQNYELWRGKPLKDDLKIDGNLEKLLKELDSIQLQAF